MSALLLVSEDEKQTESFLKNYQTKHHIPQYSVFSVLPLGKEISIDQIREIKKSVIFQFAHPQLFILFDFDTASYEAQNAFLKTLEEHSEFVHFILIVKNYHALLPTIISRLKLLLLAGSKKTHADKVTASKLSQLLESHSLAILSDKQFLKAPSESSSDIFDQILDFFRKRLSFDKQATLVLRELLKVRSAVQRNNVNLQHGIDHLLIYIRSQYLAV